MKTVGIIGWRGMVGSVLLDRLNTEGDFASFEPVFFSTSQVGQDGPTISGKCVPLSDAGDIEKLSQMDVVLTCQGGGYTAAVYDTLRAGGWNGFWIDAASTLRMNDDAVIVLDPINRDVIDRALQDGVRTFIGGNCTVSLMLMAIGGLLRQGWVEWVSAMTYQAASGAGAANMRELVSQMGEIHHGVAKPLDDPKTSPLMIDQGVSRTMRSSDFPIDQFGAPLAGSLLPWVDTEVDNGQSREEWKGFAETNKILGRPSDATIGIDGTCVRVGVMRCHSQGLTIRLNENIPMDEIESVIADSTPWTRVIPNQRDATLAGLTPTAVTGELDVPVGRLRKMNLGDHYLNAFTVGDQLLWGAAEPVRRMLMIALKA